MNIKQPRNCILVYVVGLAVSLMGTLALVSGCSQGFANTYRVVRVADGQLTIAEENGRNEKTHPVAADAKVTLNGQMATLEKLESGDAVKLTTEQHNGAEIVTEIEAESQEELGADQPIVDPHIDSPLVPGEPGTPQSSGDLFREPADIPPTESRQSSDAQGRVPQVDDPAEAQEKVADQTLSGTIIARGDGQLVVKDNDDQERTIFVLEDTVYTLGGNDAENSAESAITFTDLQVGQTVQVTVAMAGNDYVAERVDVTSAD